MVDGAVATRAILHSRCTVCCVYSYRATFINIVIGFRRWHHTRQPCRMQTIFAVTVELTVGKRAADLM